MQISTAGDIGLGAGHASDLNSFGGQVHVFTRSSSTRVLVLQGNVGQTANLTEWWNSSSTPLDVVTPNGSLGVGTSTPTDKLQVVGSSRFNGSVTVASAGTSSTVAWANSNLSATGIESIRSLDVFNGYLYAGRGDSAGDGDVMICDPSVAGDPSVCDNASDWSTSYNSAVANNVLSMIEYKGRLYTGSGDASGMGVIRYCNPATTGDPNKCDSGDWVTSNSTGRNRISAFAVYNGYLTAVGDNGSFNSGIIYTCNPAAAGNANECDNAADWTSVNLSSVVSGI